QSRQAAQAKPKNDPQKTEHDCIACDKPDQSESTRNRIPQNQHGEENGGQSHQNQELLALDFPAQFNCKCDLTHADHQCPSRDIDNQRQTRYRRCMECEESDDNPDNSDDEMEAPFWIGSATPNRAHDAKYAVDQHPRSKK